jgi:hypothetical protein
MLCGLAVVAVVAVTVQLSGCSLIGLGIGAISDASKPDEVSIPGWKLETVKPGSEVTLILRDGERISGMYVGTAAVPTADYAARYAECRSRLQKGDLLPALNDSITIFLTNGERLKRRFAGFDAQHLLVTWQGRPEPARLALKAVRAIQDSQGHLLKAETVSELMASGQIPLTSQMVVQTSEGKTTLPLEQVQMVQVPAKKHGKLTGFLIGATVDAIVIAAAASSGPDISGGDTEGYVQSCPFVYSFDGERYVLDSETFGGAIFRAAQRTDWDNLDHLREVDGTYRLKITNELKETQYIDEIKLLVVDHPRGTEVVPAFSGDLYVLSAPQAPTKAVDFRGSDVLALVRARDGDFWISDPFGRDPDNKAQVRDGLVVEFARPPDASFAKLAVNVQNTLWASYLQGQMLELHGRELKNWYDLMNRSGEARQALQQVMIREGMLLIKIWDGQSWQPAGFVWEVGPSLPKDQVVRLDLTNIPGRVLRLRLESTAGFWMINSIQADFSSDPPLQITVLSAIQAVDQMGRDLKDLLQDDDGRHYVMATLHDWAELTFVAPPRLPELERSFVLQSTGYYKIQVAAEGPPQRDLIERLMAEPGAYGQYTLRLLNRHLSEASFDLEER